MNTKKLGFTLALAIVAFIPMTASATFENTGPNVGRDPNYNHDCPNHNTGGSGGSSGSPERTAGGSSGSGTAAASNPCTCGGYEAPGLGLNDAQPARPWYSFLFKLIGREAYAAGDTTGTKYTHWVCYPCPPPDQCSNIDGYQSTIPAGYTRVGGACYGQVTASIVADPGSIGLGDYTDLTWTSENANSCTGTNFSTGNTTSGVASSTPENNTTYSLSCTGPAGSANASVAVEVLRPSATLNCTPNSLELGQSCSLAWTSQNAVSCSGSGFSTGSATSGTVSVMPLETSSYAVACPNGVGWIARANETVTVLSPSLSLSATPPRVVSGQSATVSWSASGVKSCTLTNKESGATLDQKASTTLTSFSGTHGTGPLGHDASFELKCANSIGFISSSTLVVPVAPQFNEF